MIFAAGLGTRLRPLTNDRPKALVELKGKPLLEHVILKMRQAGIERIVVNVHHYAEQIEAFLRSRQFFGGQIVVSDERECLLDTGGGLRAAREFFCPGQPVLIHNVDILSAIDLNRLTSVHQEQKHYATLVVRPGEPGRGLRFNKAGLLKGWENTLTGEQKIVDAEFEGASSFSFCGVHVVSPAFLQQMIGEGVFSIIDEYLAQALCHPVNRFDYDGFFVDLGTPEAIAVAEKYPDAFFR